MSRKGGKLARLETLVHYILQLDLEPFEKYRGGCKKPSLPPPDLRKAAQAFVNYHPMMRDVIQQLRLKLPYAVLWQQLKRAVLKDLGFSVVLSSSRRIYFEVPVHRPNLAPQDHDGVKDVTWREPVRVPQYMAPDADDMDMEADRRREYIATAANEHAMGRGGTIEEEMRLHADDEALDCPDTVTKAEWDACWPFENLIRQEPILNCDHPQVETAVGRY